MIAITVSVYYQGDTKPEYVTFIGKDYAAATEKKNDYMRFNKITRYKVAHIESIHNDGYMKYDLETNMFRLIIEYKYKQELDPPRVKVFTGKSWEDTSVKLNEFVTNGKVAWFRITSIYDGTKKGEDDVSS